MSAQDTNTTILGLTHAQVLGYGIAAFFGWHVFVKANVQNDTEVAGHIALVIREQETQSKKIDRIEKLLEAPRFSFSDYEAIHGQWERRLLTAEADLKDGNTFMQDSRLKDAQHGRSIEDMERRLRAIESNKE